MILFYQRASTLPTGLALAGLNVFCRGRTTVTGHHVHFVASNRVATFNCYIICRPLEVQLGGRAGSGLR